MQIISPHTLWLHAFPIYHSTSLIQMEPEEIEVASPSEGAVHGGHKLPYHAAKGLDYFPQVITDASGFRYAFYGELWHLFISVPGMQFVNLLPNSWVQWCCVSSGPLLIVKRPC